MAESFRAADDPAKANAVLAQALQEQQEIEPAKVVAPSDLVVDLPGGALIAGEVTKTAVVRELNGRDEEAIIRAGDDSKVFNAIINRGTVSVGSRKANEELLDTLLIGDRDALLLGIYRATFGDTAKIGTVCAGCMTEKTVEVDVLKDIKSRILADPIGDSRFTVKGKNKTFVVALPTGVTQKKLLANPSATVAETLTTLLEQTVLQIDDTPVFSKQQIQALGIVDRRAIADAISDRSPGPLFNDLTVTCPDCGGEVRVPITLGALFRF
jgi:hypothetical protein